MFPDLPIFWHSIFQLIPIDLNMKKVCFALMLVAGVIFNMTAQVANPLKGKKILVFSKTAGFRHSSIPYGISAMFELGKKYGFSVDTTQNASLFNEDNLKQYKVVVFNNTTGDVLDAQQQTAFEHYIQAGGGFVGIHAASDTEYDWAWYGKMMGGYFDGHPGKHVSNVQMGKFNVTDAKHPSTEKLPASFERKDEFYNFKQFNKDVKVLMTVDEKSYQEGTMGDFHPMAWYHLYDGGRAFYTNWGHTHETFSDEIPMNHIWGGLLWAGSGKPVKAKKTK